MNNMRFNLANEADLTCLLEIEKASFIFPWTKQQLAYEIKRKAVCVLRQTNFIVGFIILHFVADQCEIINFAMHPDYQNQGFGKQLLQAAIQYIQQRNCLQIFLEVRKSAIKVQGFYQRFGFVAMGVRKAYYALPNGKREDAIIMKLTLNGEK